MNKISGIRLFAIAVLLLLTTSQSFGREMQAQRECATCHVMWLDTFRIQGAVTLIDSIPMDEIVGAGAAEEKMCYSCHDGFVLDSRHLVWTNYRHPVDVMPSKNIKFPKREDGTIIFPLNVNGKLYCGSCHTAHGVAWEGKTEDIPVFMRGSNKDSSFCKMCHQRKRGGAPSGNHPIDKTSIHLPEKLFRAGGKEGSTKNRVICQSCHMVHGAKEKKILITKNENSQLCGICHSDRYTRDLPDARKQLTHPVNITSEKIEISEAAKKLGSKTGSGGEIICQTCHQPHNAVKGNGILVKDNYDSSLCRQCHVDKNVIMETKHNMQKTSPASTNIKGQSPFKGGPCSACHLPHRGRGPKMWAQEISGDEDIVSDMCKGCHAEGKAGGKKPIGDHSHPVNAEIQKVGGKTSLPLFDTEATAVTTENQADGKVVCSTCHNVHQWNWKNPKKAAIEEGDGTNSFLRMPAAPAPDLCIDCHQDKKYVVKTDHDMRITSSDSSNIKGENVEKTGVCGTCHMIHNAPVKAKLWARELSGKGDIIAQICTSCHNAEGPAKKKLIGEHTHPTGKPVSYINITISDDGAWSHPYLEALPQDERVELIPLPFFDEEGNKVASGEVSCGSCHDPHQWNPTEFKEGKGRNLEGDGTNSFLRLSNDPDSGLCKNCHVEKRSVAFSKHNLKITAPGDKNIEGRSAKKTGICSSCHLPHNGTGPKMWARKADERGDSVERLCKGCHKKGGAAEKKLTGDHSHPVGKSIRNIGIEPVSRNSWRIASNDSKESADKEALIALPLYSRDGKKVADGNITCGSCHDPHQWDPNTYPREALVKTGDATKSMKKHFADFVKRIKKENGDGTNSFLRISNAPDSGLCKNCHIDKRPVELTKHNMDIVAKDEKNVQGLTTQQSGSCSACHLPHNGVGPKMWARSVNISDDTMSELCRSCHSEEAVGKNKLVGNYSHPLNADIEKIGAKTDLPLYNKMGEKTTSKLGGRVVCPTCHNPHQWNPQDVLAKDGASKNVEGNATNSFLRSPAAPYPTLCINCHDDKKFVEFTDHDLTVTAPEAKNSKGQTVNEAGKCGACHMVHNAPTRTVIWAPTPGPGDDGIEKLCRSCHNENGIARNKLPQYFNHPANIMVTSNYKRSAENKAKKSLPIFKLDGTRNATGVITCATCHNPHQWSSLNPGYGPGKNEEGNSNNSFLRKLSDFTICSDCHGFDGIFRYKYYHGATSRNKTAPLY